ncbi:KAP P-loop domain-containing protein [Acetobacter malorum DSM 14337]|uniref:KAP P-loop domain-containing protein n=2 Tax=Acetobacter malorum TaxID=178901 RepID=A0ABQ0PXX6_9PROT|nr:hypothetical protein AD930_01105 [Acetobacter malorum]GBQ84332.1 KAP P-loop domain-containing protein [Acetobacter malorum DSM 14337]
MKPSTFKWAGPNLDLIKTLDEYCYGEEEIPFAIMLRGTWGCGKTWLVDRFFEEKKKNRKNDDIAGFPLRVSLFGVASATEIGDALYAELHPILAGKPGQVGSFVVRSLLKTTLRIDLNDLTDKKNKEKSSESITLAGADLGILGPDGKPRRRIIVFDDLERANMPKPDILAAIHPLISNGENRVLLLANEEEIIVGDKDATKQYLRTKEKTVCLTLEVKPDFQSAFSKIEMKIKDPDFKNFFKILRNHLELLAVKAGMSNLRLLSFFVPLGETLFKNIKTTYRTESHYAALSELFICVYIRLIENRIYGVPLNLLNKLIKNPSQPKNSFLKSDEPTPSETDRNNAIICTRLKTYDYMFLRSPLISPDSLEALVMRGTVQAEAINASLALDNRFTEQTELPSWLRVWNYSLSSEQELDKAVAAFMIDFENRKFVDLDMLHACSIYLTLHRVGQEGFNASDPVDCAKNYIKDVFAKKNMFEERIRMAIADPNHLSLFPPFGRSFSEEGSQDFQIIKGFYFSEQKLWLEKQLTVKSIELQSLFDENWDKFISLLFRVSETEPVYEHLPILQHLNTIIFSRKIISLPADHRMYLIACLKERYEKTVHHSSALHPECDWFSELSKALSDAVAQSDGSPLFKEGLKATIEPLCDAAKRTPIP